MSATFKTIEKKVVYLNVGSKKYRYIEIIQEVVPEIIDLTEDEPPSCPNTPMSRGPIYQNSPSAYLTSPEYRSQQNSPRF